MQQKDDYMTIRLPSWLKLEVSEMAKVLGVSASELSLLTLEIVLGQPKLLAALGKAVADRRQLQAPARGRPSLKVLLPRRPQDDPPGASNQAPVERLASQS